MLLHMVIDQVAGMVADIGTGMVADKVADMVVGMAADKKKLFLSDMLLHMVADKVVGMVADKKAKNIYFCSWLTCCWTWWATWR